MANRFHKKRQLENHDAPPSATDASNGVDDAAALLALVNHRTEEIAKIKYKISFYTSQLDMAEKSLRATREKLALLHPPFTHQNDTPHKPAEMEPTRPVLVLPSKSSNAPPQISLNVARQDTPLASSSSSSRKSPKKTKRKIVGREHCELIPGVRKNDSAQLLNFQMGNAISSWHKRKMRCLELCPTNDNLFVTTALDGAAVVWQLQTKGPSASLISTTDCLSPKLRKWPEDIAWNPNGDSIVAVYSADGGDSQVSILNLKKSGEKRVTFLATKAHTKGIINSVNFMPWADMCFASGGSDHMVVLWKENGDCWEHKTLHTSFHSSSVMGVAGLQQKKILLSVGRDKRIIGYDVSAGKADFKHQIDTNCLSVLPNPLDFNLYMIQTVAPGKQLRLFDVRLRCTEIHSFGWTQESSELQSALINQSWSPDGWHLSSGSADPVIHIFDIRYNGSTPSQSVQAHQKRVFKALWHQSAPILTSISSDLTICMHKVS